VPTAYLELNGSKIYYTCTGSGKLPLILFHGFGQTHVAFRSLEETLSKQYTLYSFDLFFHGDSKWSHHERPLEKEEWKKLMEAFLKQNSISSFSVLGFSMGGKFALATLEAFPNQTKEIFLLAPDGIKTSFWYSLATYPLIFRNIFKSMIDHPKRFYAIAELAHRLGVIDKGVLRFVEYQMNTEEKRERVYLSWVVFRHLNFNQKKIASIINEGNIQLTLLVGRYDKIITAANMNLLLQHVTDYRFEILEAGHNDLIEKSANYFRLMGMEK
jgi:Predicted hydrolases or acyltransferases (alpha/beta hydrolase superfamily)